MTSNPHTDLIGGILYILEDHFAKRGSVLQHTLRDVKEEQPLETPLYLTDIEGTSSSHFLTLKSIPLKPLPPAYTPFCPRDCAAYRVTFTPTEGVRIREHTLLHLAERAVATKRTGRHGYTPIPHASSEDETLTLDFLPLPQVKRLKEYVGEARALPPGTYTRIPPHETARIILNESLGISVQGNRHTYIFNLPFAWLRDPPGGKKSKLERIIRAIQPWRQGRQMGILLEERLVREAEDEVEKALREGYGKAYEAPWHAAVISSISGTPAADGSLVRPVPTDTLPLRTVKPTLTYPPENLPGFVYIPRDWVREAASSSKP